MVSRETGTHSRARGGCHVSTFSGRGMTSIVEQLHKLPAKISLLALMMNSEPHREAVLKVLKQAYVPHNASIEKIDRLVGNVMMDNYISFSDDEIPDRKSVV